MWAAHSTGSHRDIAMDDAASGSLGDAPARAPAFSQTTVRDGTQLPDFAAISNVDEKKSAFYAYMLPLIREANAEVAAERRSEIRELTTASRMRAIREGHAGEREVVLDYELTSRGTEPVYMPDEDAELGYSLQVRSNPKLIPQN